jgi:hypothetical protein
MRIVVLVAAVGAVASVAHAEVSDDLRFCGALKAGQERLACYDAAARIAQRPRTPLQAVSTSAYPPMEAQSSITKAAPTLIEAPPNKFAGTYVALGGGYGVESGRSSYVSGYFTSGAPFSVTPSGGHGSVAVGHDIAVGSGIVGLEFGGRFEGESQRETAISAPFQFSAIAGSASTSYSFKNDIGLHLALRGGLTFDDLLIFGKVGVGASRIAESFASDERGIAITFCTPGVFISPCYGPVATPPGLRTSNVTSWVPSALLGVGVEKQWGPVFGRVGADFEAFNLPTTTTIVGSSSSAQITWVTRGTAMVGYRF